MNSARTNLAATGPRIAIALAIAAALAACASTPRDSDRLIAARNAVQRATVQGDVTGAAKADLDTARTNLQQAETALRKGRPANEVDTFAYVAEQSAMAAINRNDAVILQKKVEAAEGERSAILLEAREREAKMAQHKAETAEMEAARLQQVAQQQSAALDRTQQQLNVTAAQLGTASAQLDAASAQIEELKAQKTDRGMVLTLGDVLFDSGSATLKPGAERSLEPIAEHMKRNDNARLMVEGHTDSLGDDAYNQRLSQLRAESVAAKLVHMGIASARVSAIGLGEAYPVTGNETAPGRQQNRRVEIIFSDNSGQFPAASQRTASSR